jgi:seryl-tRNA synthetase
MPGLDPGIHSAIAGLRSTVRNGLPDQVGNDDRCEVPDTMLDIRWIRENPEALDRALRNRGAEPAAERLIALDEARRAAIQTLQEAQTRRNLTSKEIGQAKAAKDAQRAEALMAQVAALKETMQALEAEERAAEKALNNALAIIPNVPEDDVPVGPDEHANIEARRWGEPKRPNFAKEHFELGEALGQMDFETAAKLSGSRFVVLKAGLARMERALGQFMVDLHTEEHGYTEVQPPVLVKDDTLFGTGQLPKFAQDQFRTRRTDSIDYAPFAEELKHLSYGELQSWFDSYRDPMVAERIWIEATEGEPEDKRSSWWLHLAHELGEHLRVQQLDLWLIPTAEVPLTNLVRESILSEEQLPLRFTALTPCFRSEAGSAGRDTRGMLRQHQFNKVELVSITTPEQSRDEHERMTECAEEVLKRLELAYRVMVLSTGDMGFGARKTYDLEVWLPGQKAYREISSCSICGDFQARRMQARYRAKGEKNPRLVHTLNGSGVAVGRALIAVMETYQNEDGSIAVPDALRPYMRGVERIEASP